MLLKKDFGKRFFTVFTSVNLHLFFFFNSVFFFLFISSLLLDCFNLSSEIFTCCFPVVRSFFKPFGSFKFVLLLFVLLLFDNCCLLFIDESFSLRVELFSFTHENQLTSFSMFFQSFSIEFSSASLRTLNKVRLTWH